MGYDKRNQGESMNVIDTPIVSDPGRWYAWCKYYVEDKDSIRGKCVCPIVSLACAGSQQATMTVYKNLPSRNTVSSQIRQPLQDRYSRSIGVFDWHWRIRRYFSSFSQGAPSKMEIIVSAPIPAQTIVSKSLGILLAPSER